MTEMERKIMHEAIMFHLSIELNEQVKNELVQMGIIIINGSFPTDHMMTLRKALHHLREKYNAQLHSLESFNKVDKEACKPIYVQRLNILNEIINHV